MMDITIQFQKTLNWDSQKQKWTSEVFLHACIYQFAPLMHAFSFQPGKLLSDFFLVAV